MIYQPWLSTLATSESRRDEIERILQARIDKIVRWAEVWGLKLNLPKTVSMFFTRGTSQALHHTIKNTVVKQVEQKKYLGFMVDPQLTFSLHVDYAVSKTKKALAKVSLLIKGRFGLPVHIGIELYKLLIRTHMEYTAPVWASLKEADLSKLERCQSDSLRKVSGAKKCSSIKALEVILGILPFRLRIHELCIREYGRLMAKDDRHFLKRLLNTAVRVGQDFSPMAYINLKSRPLQKALNGCQISKEYIPLPDDILGKVSIPYLDLFKEQVGNSSSRTVAQKAIISKTFDGFLRSSEGRFTLIFTDGSVSDGPVGCGAGAALLVPPNPDLDLLSLAEAVGQMVDNVECEIVGIKLATDLALEYLRSSTPPESKVFFICCDCTAAIDAVRFQRQFAKHANSFREININLGILKRHGCTICLVWSPGHANIVYNEMVDSIAKKKAKESKGLIASQENSEISKTAIHSLIRKLLWKEWQTQWSCSDTGSTTREYIPDVSSKIALPRPRSIAISYIRILLGNTTLNLDMFHQGLAPSPMCECNLDNQSVDHFLCFCPLFIDQRMTLFRAIKEITPRSNISTHLLLGHRWDESLSTESEKKVREALFQFLADTCHQI